MEVGRAAEGGEHPVPFLSIGEARHCSFCGGVGEQAVFDGIPQNHVLVGVLKLLQVRS